FFSVFYANQVPQFSQSSYIKVFEIFAFQPLPMLIGYLTGMEIPLLLEFRNQAGARNQPGLVLGICYFGNLLGSIGTAALLIPRFDVIVAGGILGFLNLTAAVILIYTTRASRSIPVLAGFLAGAMAIALPARYQNEIKQVYLKAFYTDL